MKAPANPQELDRVRTALLVAQHYASLEWAVTPGFHTRDETNVPICSKHPSVGWKETKVAAGLIVGATTDPSEIEDYWLGRGSDPLGADICIHTKPSHLIVIDTDRAWKEVVITDANGNRQPVTVFVDGLAAFLEFMGGDVGTELISVSKRGVHFFYLVDSELAAKIRNRCNWLPGVDVRGGGESSGGVSIETNGVCPHRGWAKGQPTIEPSDNEPEGVIAGLERYPDIRFDKQGNCIEGLPKMTDGRVDGCRPLPTKLLDALLESSRAVPQNKSQLQKRHQHAVAVHDKQPRKTRKASDSKLVDARQAASSRPYSFKSQCECGGCSNFDEARELLAWVPPEVDYDAWRNLLWSLADLLDGSACGAALAEESSADGQKRPVGDA